MKPFIHPTAQVDKSAKIGEDTQVWSFVQVMENAVIGKNCNLGSACYIDRKVKVGNNVKVHNKALLYNGLIVEDDVFIGPAVCFTNDKNPRHNLTRNLEKTSWKVAKGASVGACAVIMPDVNIGQYAMVGAGSVVTKDVPDHALVVGNPARIKAFVCFCGQKLEKESENKLFIMKCLQCKRKVEIKKETYQKCQN